MSLIHKHTGGLSMNNKNILLILIIILLLVVIILGVSFYMMSSKTSKSAEEVLKIDKNIIMYSFDDSFVSNIKESRRILKITIKIELANKKIEELIKAREPEIRNEINFILRSKTEQDLEGSEGQTKLQKQILESIRKIIKSEKVLNVYFDEFIIN